MVAQYAKWSKMARETAWRKPVASLNYLLTSHVWQQDHNGYSHQGPGFINTLLTRKREVTRIYLPPDANCLLSIADHCLRSRDHINLIVASKNPMPQWLDMPAAREHCAQGASVWNWAGNELGQPDVIMAAADDVPTLETTTPFDMTVVNELSRYHLAIEALRRVPRMRSIAGEIMQKFEQKLIEHHDWICSHDEDMPEVLNWKWSVGQRAGSGD